MICDARSVRSGVGIGDRHHDPERGAFCAGREPLVAVDHVVVAVAHRAGAERRRVRPGHLGLGHREERADLAGDEREEPALLLLVGAEQVQDLGVAGVGCLAAEHELPPERAADLLVQVRVVEEAGAGAAGFGWDVRRPEARRFHLRPQLGDERVGCVVLAVERRFVRQRRGRA